MAHILSEAAPVSVVDGVSLLLSTAFAAAFFPASSFARRSAGVASVASAVASAVVDVVDVVDVVCVDGVVGVADGMLWIL